MSEITFTEFDGINNVKKPQRLSGKDLVAAVNVDLDDTKRLSRRAGTAIVSTGGAHSIWAEGALCLFRRGTGLYRLNADDTVTLIGSPFTSNNPCAYVPATGGVFFSDGVTKGWTDGSSLALWGITPPISQPDAAAIAGQLPPGQYRYAITFLRADGEESGAIEAGEITLGADAGISFSALQVSAEAGVTHKALYVTDAGGEHLKRAMVLANAATSATWTGGNLGITLRTMLMIPLPASPVITMDHGRIAMGYSSFVLYTPPFTLERFRPDEHFVSFDAAVRMIVPVSGGRYVCTDTGIYWLPGGDIAKASVTKVASYGTSAGSPAYVDGALLGKDGIPTTVPLIPTSQGFCAGLPDGQLLNLTIKRFWPPTAKWVSSGYVREAGKNRAMFFFLT